MKLIISCITLCYLSCTSEPLITPNFIDEPNPTDTFPSVNPLYNYDLLWAMPIVSDTGANANEKLPIIYKNNLLFGGVFDWLEGGYDQYLVLFNADTQEQVWKWDGFNSNYGNREFHEFSIHEEVFYGRNADKSVFAIDLQNGSTLWKVDARRSKLSFSNGFLFYNNNKSYTQPAPASLYKFNPTNQIHELIYRIEGDGEWFNFLKSCTSTHNQAGDEILYFIQTAYRNSPFEDNTILHCYNNATKTMLWQYETHSSTFSSNPPIIEGNRVYFGTQKEMFCLNKDTGELIWMEKSTHTGYSSLYKLVEGKIIRISLEGYFKALDKMTGAIIYEHQYGTNYLDNMEYLDGRMYYADGSQLNIIDVATGERLYRWKTKNKDVDEPAFRDHVALDPERGVLYVSDWYFMNCIRIPE